MQKPAKVAKKLQIFYFSFDNKNMSNELNVFVNKFIANHNIAYEGNQEEEFKKLVDYFHNGIYTFDRPDGYCIQGNNVLLIEHFEFDSSYKNKKGSKNRQELFRTSNFKFTNNDEIQIYKDEINCDFTIENYINNAISNLKSHYEKIKDYETNLKNKNIITTETTIESLFCIEDTTTLGNIDANNGSPLFLLYCEEFIEEIRKCSNLSYIICGSSFGQNDYTWFSSVSNIDNYTPKYNKDNITIANLTPQTMTSIIKI